MQEKWIWDHDKENCFRIEDIKIISIETYNHTHENRRVMVKLDNGQTFILNSFSNKKEALNFAESLFGEDNYVR